MTTTVTLTFNGTLINGTPETVDVVINGQDFGPLTLSNIPGGYVDTNGIAWDSAVPHSFSLSGLVPISSIKVAITSPLQSSNGGNSSLFFDAVSVNGVNLPIGTFQALTGSAVTGALPGGIYDGGYATFDATPWNSVLVSQTWVLFSGLKTLDATHDPGESFAINLSGQIAGDLYNSGNGTNGRQAFLLAGGVTTNLADLGGGYSDAAAINDAGQIAGTVKASDGSIHAVIWQNGKLTDLGTLGGDACATGINDAGQVVGYSNNTSDVQRAFLWQNGAMTDLGDLGGGTADATAIDASGQVVGTSFTASGAEEAFLWQTGKMTGLGDLGGGMSVAAAINASAQIVGSSTTAAGAQQAFLYQKGVMTDLGDLGGGISQAMAINDAGAVVGNSLTADGHEHAFLWVSGKGMIDLNSEIAASSNWVLENATGINDLGQIVGYGTYEGYPQLFELTLGGGISPISLSAQGAATYLSDGLAAAPLTVTDSAADIAASLASLESLVSSGKVNAVTLTDSGIPNLTITAAEQTADAAALDAITSPHTLTLQIAGNAGQHDFSQDNLSGISAVQFADQTVIVAATPGPANAITTGNVTELYSAVLAREPDIAGLAFYQNFLKSNPSTPLQQFAEFFLLSNEYISAHSYAQSTAGDEQFIEDSYQNLLHRTPSASEVSYYETNVLAPAVANLTPGTASYANAALQAHALMLVYFSNSAEFLGDVEITAAHPADAAHWLVLI